MHPIRHLIRLTEAGAFHPALNSELWEHDSLKPLVRLKLFQTAVAFYKFLDVNLLIVNDIIVTGSNAAFNYTALSDIDVHLIVDFEKSTCPKLADNLFLTKKALWAQTYGVTILGYPVELYVEDIANPVKANGVYSILHNVWRKQPSPVRPASDDLAVVSKLTAYSATIEEMLDGEPTPKDVDDMIQRLRTLRQNGLETGGEFSTENLAYKALRDGGYIERLLQKRIELRDRHWSL